MEKTSSVIAAFDAGKLPSQQQINDFVDWTLHNVLPYESPEIDRLSDSGKTIARSLSQVLVAYKQLGTNKNHDNLVQNTLWHLSECDLSVTRVEAGNLEEASADMDALRSALRTLLKIFWANVGGEGSHLLGDFASFARLALADLAEALETKAGQTKESLRVSESEVERGERDPLGRKYKSPEAEEKDSDPKVKFEKTMDTVKEAGSKAIGVGQSVKVTTEEKVEKTSTKLTDAFYKVCDRAQSDEEYKRALSTLFNIASKWLNRTLDTAATTDEASLDALIEDPTPEKHLHQALTNFRTLFERAAGGRSLEGLCSQLRECALDVKQDEDLKAWFDDFIAHVRTSLETPGYVRGQEAREKREELERRWEELIDSNSNVAKKWKDDVAVLRRELNQFQQAIVHDPDLRHVRDAHARLMRDMEESAIVGGRLGMQSALEHASWFWQDLLNVYTQRVLGVLKHIPIPRTEYVDEEVEFVLENLDISSLNLLPGHAYIRNITDIDISAPGETTSSATTSFGSLTHIRLQAIQLSLKDVSFYYRDKISTVGPSAFTGLMQFNLPTQGLDVDFKLRLIPNTPQGLSERERDRRFFKIERVDVKMADDIKLDVKESNHPIFASVFKPILVIRFKDAIERTLEEHIRGAFDFVDGIAFDISKRSEVFSDTGLGPGASLVAAMWSEMGRLRRMEGGLLSGWKATGTGIVKEGRPGEPTIAMGAEPQILSGKKRGPLGYGSEPVAAGFEARAQPVSQEAQKVAEQLKGLGEEGVKRVQSFRESVQHKVAEEKKRPGWESFAFDLA